MTETIRIEKSKEKGTGEYVASVIVNAIMLLVINLYAVWRPWTKGVITQDWPQVLWAANLAGAVQVVGGMVLVASRPRWLARLGELVFSVVSLISAAVLYSVFPFDFGRIGAEWMNTVTRVLLMIGLFGGSIAVVVNLVKLFSGPGPRRTVLHT